MEYAVVYEQGVTNWGAIVSDLPGCVSIGVTLEEIQQKVRKAMEVYIEVLHEKGEPIPRPRHRTGTVNIPVA